MALVLVGVATSALSPDISPELALIKVALCGEALVVVEVLAVQLVGDLLKAGLVLLHAISVGVCLRR